jgi:hypothetical protein
MQFKRYSFVLLVILWPGILLLLSACDFVMASNSSSKPSPSPISAASPLPTPTPTAMPDLSPNIEAAIQQRVSEILTPSPWLNVTNPEVSNRKASLTPAPALAQLETAIPEPNSKAEYYVSGFACTGSMRPTIDCGDEAVLLKPPFPEPLIVGDIVSFSPAISCRYYKNHHISKAHRIIALRVEGDVAYYTTKGDATRSPDPCEITLDQIDGKLVEIRKGVRPQDIIDTSEYDLAKARVDILKAEYEAKRKVFDNKKAAYDTQGEEYRQLVSGYEAGQVTYGEVAEFHQQLEEQGLALNQLKNELNSLGEKINAAIDEVGRLYQKLFVR